MTGPFDLRRIALVAAVVLVEGLLVLGGVVAARPAPRPCRDATRDAGTLTGATHSEAWGVEGRTEAGGRLIGVSDAGAGDATTGPSMPGP